MDSALNATLAANVCDGLDDGRSTAHCCDYQLVLRRDSNEQPSCCVGTGGIKCGGV